MNSNTNKQTTREDEKQIPWPEFLGFTAFVAAVRANFRDYGYSVSRALPTGSDYQFTVINNVHGRYRYVLVLADRRGTVVLKRLNGYPEREISVEELFKGNVVEILWPNTDPEILYPDGVGVIR